MKIEPTKLTKIIEQNYSLLMPDFFEMQTEYLASLNIIYHDLDASLIAMVLTSQLYKNTIKDVNSKETISGTLLSAQLDLLDDVLLPENGILLKGWQEVLVR